MATDFDGRRYRETSTHQKEWGAGLIDELNLKGNERILDVGCGDGILTASLADGVPFGSVLGIDASPGMIDTARTQERPNLSFQLLDVLDANFCSEFDVVFSNATLHWVKDHEMLLSILYRALKESGLLRVNFAGEGNCSTLNRVVQDIMASDEYRQAFAGFEWPWYMPSVDGYGILVRGSDFGSAEVWGEVADRDFPDTEAMLGWLDHPAIVPFKKYLDSETAESFHKAVAARMIDETRQPTGTCFETFRRINLVARK